MARMPGAEWLGEHSPRTPMTRYDIVCVHTIVGFAPAHAAHFSVKADGTIQQSRDTAFRSGANLDGNHRVIAIENEDHGPGFPTWTGSDVPALTPEQVEANARILAWAHKEHGIPLQICPDSRPGSMGLAYHRQGVDGNFGSFDFPGRVDGGEVWTLSPGKACPGDRRIAQRPAILARALELVAPTDRPGTQLVGFNGAWHLPRDRRRGIIEQSAALGEILAGVECKWLDAQRVLGDQWLVLQGEGQSRANLVLAFDREVVTEVSAARWSIGTTPDMPGFPTAKMLTRPILEADVLVDGEWLTIFVSHGPPKRYVWLYARWLRNLRRRMSQSQHPVAVFADWNRYAASVATGTGLRALVREVVGWAVSPGLNVSPARRVPVGGDHPAVVVTLRKD